MKTPISKKVSMLLPMFLFGTSFGGMLSAQTTVTSVSAASYGAIVAPGSLVSSFGSNLASTTEAATSTPLPTSLANAQLSITDSAKVTVAASLVFVSPTQINYVVPNSVALGAATINITSGTGNVTGTMLISNVSPAFFTANASGSGVPAAEFTIVDSAGNQTIANAFQGTAGDYTPLPVSLSAGTVYLALYGTGIARHSANPVIVTINGVSVPVVFAGSQGQFAGLDQLNVGPLPTSLSGAGQVNVVVTVDGIPANTVQIAVQ